MSDKYLKYNVNVHQLPEPLPPNMVVVLDTETTGLHKLVDKPFMCLLRISPVGSIDHSHYAISWSPGVARWLSNNLPRAARVVCHNAKYDWHMMRNGGVNPDSLYESKVYCTLVAEALIDEHKRSYSLDNLGMEYFGEGKDDEIYRVMGGHFMQEPSKKLMGRVFEFAEADPAYWHIVARYGIQDVELTYKLYCKQQKELTKQELDRVFALEMRTLKALVEVEKRGVPVDVDKTEEVESRLITRQHQIQEEITKVVGINVNPRSPLQMEQAFFRLGLPITRLKSGNATFAKDVISMIDHPFTRLLQESRNVKTMLDTFIGGSIGKNLYRGRIHTDFNQVRGDDYGTGTGRLSSSGPNLQQIPKRDGELAPLIRGLFVAPKGMMWIANDWEQFEFRVFAHYVRDMELIHRYLEDPHTDFHTALAEMTGKPRDKAKRINLGLVFGMGEGKLAKELGLPYEVSHRHGKEILIAGAEAKALFDEYHSKFPKARTFLQEASHLAKTRGYIKTLYGRRIRFPGGEFTHKAGGLVFQGTSADLMKKKLCELNDEFRKSEVEFILIVHDEFCLIAPESMAESTAEKVKEITETVPELRVPILADAGIGVNWWECK